MLFVSRHRQVRLRGEEMVKTAFVDAGALADLVHAHRAVTVVPDQVEGHLKQFLLSITRFSHTPHKLPKLTGQSSGLFKKFSWFHFQRSPWVSAKFAKELLRQRECLAPRPLIEAVSDNAIAVVVTPG